MPILTKPCKGKLSEQTQQQLCAGHDRAEWGIYPCEICGQNVGVLSVNGEWVPERHWPSIDYAARKPGVDRKPNVVREPPKNSFTARGHLRPH